MIIEKNKVVSIVYELWIDDGDQEKVLFDKKDRNSPLLFFFGTGGLLQQFENNLEGKTIGDHFDFFLDYEHAYGDYEEEKVMYLPKSTFIPKGKFKVPAGMLKKGAIIPMKDKHGNTRRAEILSIELTRVQVDFNHKLAGYDLYFKGEILDIREATAEEIAHGHVHGPHGHHH